GVVDLSVSGIPGADVAFEIYDLAHNRLLLVNSQGEGKPERLPNLLVSTKLYVKVYSAKKGAGGSYTLTALFSEPRPGFESEPNDRAADANPVALGQPISGIIGHATDEDWFRYELPNPTGSAPDAGMALDAGAAEEVLVDGGLSDAGRAAAGLLASSGIALRIELSAVEGVRYEL